MSDDELRLSPLDELHDAAGARMVPFAGWRMPLQFDGILAEHRAVRTDAGIFDVSHMGQLLVRGAAAAERLQRVLSADLRAIAEPGRAQYTLLLSDDGGIEDDLIAYRFDRETLLLVVNASRRDHDAAILAASLADAAELEDATTRRAMFALQGPAALDVLADHLVDVRELPPFRVQALDAHELVVATTGYTGERGCELSMPAERAAEVWGMLVGDERVQPCGLGARDSLRLEACYPLYGADIHVRVDPVAAGLSFAVAWGLPAHLRGAGHDALRAIRERGPGRRLVPLRALERGIPRAGCVVLHDGEPVGEVSSGTMSPMLGEGIALAWIDARHAAIDMRVEVDVRGRRVACRVVRRPFWRGSLAAG